MLTLDVQLVNRAAPCHLLAWRSWTLKRVATGTLSAETQAMEQAVGRLEWLSRLIAWAAGVSLPVDLRTDCKSLQQAIATCHAQEDKRLAVQLESLKEDLGSGKIRSIHHIPGLINPADALTKKASTASIDRLREVAHSGLLRDIDPG